MFALVSDSSLSIITAVLLILIARIDKIWAQDIKKNNNTVPDGVNLVANEASIQGAEWVNVIDPSSESFIGAVGSNDELNRKPFVCRAWQNRDWIPGNFDPSEGLCAIAYAKKSFTHRSFQFLRKNWIKFAWKAANNGATPTGAVQGGVNVDNEALFIGRVSFQDHYRVGKIHPSHKRLYLTFNGTEYNFQEYEALCVKAVFF